MDNQRGLKPIDAKIQKLQQRIATLRAERRLLMLEGLINAMRENDFSLELLTAAYTAAQANGGTRQSIAVRRGRHRPVPPKYRHPNTGETWSGRGKTPRWLMAAELTGTQRQHFLIRERAEEKLP